MHETTRVRKTLLAGTLALVLASSSTCGYILHPERRGQPPTGELDVAVVVMDVLWFLPGIIPGVIAVVVDATTNAWYLPRGRRAGREPVLAPGTKLALRVPSVSEPTTYVLRLRAPDGKVLGRFRRTVGSEDSGKTLLMDPSRAVATARFLGVRSLALEIEVDGRLLGVRLCRLL